MRNLTIIILAGFAARPVRPRFSCASFTTFITGEFIADRRSVAVTKRAVLTVLPFSNTASSNDPRRLLPRLINQLLYLHPALDSRAIVMFAFDDTSADLRQPVVAHLRVLG